MIMKFALCEVVPLDNNNGKVGIVKTASGRVFVEPNSDKARIIEGEIEKHPTSLFFRAKAIKADEPNSNGDYFSEEELLKAYKSFEGVPFFTNHDNQNVENARGKIIFAEWDTKEKAVYTIAFVDREAFPHICRSIEEDYVTGVSMGCSVEYSICNICGNKAEKTEDYCSHIKERKGRTFSGKARNVRTGETKDFKNELVFEYNYGIKFIELSAVVDPACPSCRIEGLLANDDYMRRVAIVENALRMIKTSAIEKEASQEEIDQLNQVLGTLEGIAISLIQNRQQVEVEFASDLVAILSDLQKFVDELIGAGYGNVQGVPGVADSQAGLIPPAGESVPTGEGVLAGLEAAPVAAEAPIAEAPVGTVSGSPSKPLVQRPQLPITAPAKPIAFDSKKLKKIAGFLGGLQKISDKMQNKGEDNMGERRTLVKRKEQAKVATEVLSNLWKEKQKFFMYINRVPSIQDNKYKLSVKKRDDSFVIVAEDKENSENQKNWTFENLTDKEKKMVEDLPKEAALYFLDTFANSFKTNIKEGDTEMTDNIREAGAQSVNKSPEVITEKQLDEGGLYHSRTDVEQNVITQKQLEDRRSGEKNVITEKQLEEKSNKLNPRKDEEKEVITEAQLQGDGSSVSSRKDNAPNVITQKQLDDYRTNTDPDVITEKQLASVDTPWERAASRDSSLFKSASEHMQAVIDVLADSAISTGCTPQEASDVAGSLIGSTKDRFELGNAVLDEAQEEDVDYSKRLAYWSAKNIKVANVGNQGIAEAIVRGLRRVASDITINPEVIIDALDVATEGNEGIEAISKRIDDKLEEAKKETVKASKKDELRHALKGNDGKKERDEERKEIESSLNKEDNKLTREAERALWEKSVEEEKKPDIMIETSFEEIGCSKNDKGFRPAIKSFARGALASQNIKLAAITNVTINGDTISIAVQTDGGEEAIDIPIGEEIAPMEEEIVPEGDLAGEGLEAAVGELGKVSPQTGLPVSASKKQGLKKQAQSPMGGGVPGTPGEVAGGPGSLAGGGVPDAAPMDTPVESLTIDEKAVSDEIPTAGEQQMPYAICPECGSSDVDIEKDASGGIKGGCNNCGAEYEALVKRSIEFKIVKPTRSIGEEGTVGDLESPEVPALPVAAQTRLDKDVIVRVASNKQKYGHVCPACGMNQCKVASEKSGHTEYTCPACGTDVEKDVVINVNNPDESYLRVKWDVVPNLENCEGCDEAAIKFASMMKIEKMMKQATKGETEFPMANCIERIARTYGGNTTATFGPCKGKLLTDCVCGQLQRLGLTKVRHMERLASVYTQKDPMDECIGDQMKKNFDRKEAENICNCLKKKFASEEDDNIFIQAFADDIRSGKEKILTAQDLGVINDLFEEEAPAVEEDLEDIDIGDAIEEEQAGEIAGEEMVTIEVSKDTAEELADAAADAAAEVEVEVDLEVEETPEVVEEIPEMAAATEIEVASDSTDKIEINTQKEKDMVEAMKSHKLRRVGDEIVKVAGEPKKVEDIEGNVKSGVPRAKATMGEEGADNIDVPMAKPNVPRANAEMGQEGPSNINPPAGLPNVAVDSAYMGTEKAVQKDMPAINNEIKGTVIAKKDAKTIKEAKQLKEVETVEKDVKSGVPRAKATMGEEGADNIDVPMAKPSVPRANAEMGNESADNINPKADGPDVPVDSAYMGDEKAVQKGMPAINDEILKNVQQNSNKEKQQERISSARRMKATEVASKLLATNRIPEAAYEDVIDALSNFQIDKIAVKADTMYPKKVVKANQDPNVHSIPAIVMESKKIESSDSIGELTNRIASQFTVGNKSFDEGLARFGEK